MYKKQEAQQPVFIDLDLVIENGCLINENYPVNKATRFNQSINCCCAGSIHFHNTSKYYVISAMGYRDAL